MAGIYIHIPFCKQKCHYCNFHFSTQMKGKGDMLHALIREIDLRKEEIAQQRIDTIYLGGGTPSLFSPDELTPLFQIIHSITGGQDIQEVTIECNPEDLTIEYLDQLGKSTPVDRISVGIQSFIDEDLKIMNRAHNASESRKALDNIFEAGFEEVSADLIFGLPNSNTDKWWDNLQALTSYPVNHISCYNLTIEDKTAFKHQLLQGQISLPNDEETVEQFYMAKDLLTDKGYIHYEISNYGQPGHMALHNTSYWKNVPYFGIGPSAHSYDGKRRRWNVADNQKYIKRIATGEKFWDSEELTEQDRYNEYIMTGLRTIWGVDKERIAAFSEPVREGFKKNVEKEKEKGNIKQKNGTLLLSPRGQAVADQVVSEFFSV